MGFLLENTMLLVAAVAVQAFMLLQAGITYVLLRWRHRHHPFPSGLSPLLHCEDNKMSIIIPAYNEGACVFPPSPCLP